MFKMLVRLLNTLRSRIWDMPVFLFSDYFFSLIFSCYFETTNSHRALKFKDFT
ncbi:hypothetical protein [Anaerobutyricum soehngenii]|uniref:hypothetical protein n=1 Tax=Anaerobutyricum soehngenii TaxID=105843 RepID=UPI001ADD78A3|nr:hypothetical protein [Anaerobutyricum soehngenii]